MMKKYWMIAGLAAVVLLTASCGGPRRNPGRAYMPDMAYSRAYETYASTENLKAKGINYTAMPVTGTLARGEMLAIYPYANDSAGYVNSASVKSPLTADSVDMKEAERLYLINCGICHGTKLDGNGPLWKDGNGPYPNKPAALVGDAKYVTMAEGTMFHSLTYGRNNMGSYASQLSTKQRWEVIAYIKMKQNGTGAKVDSAKATAPVMDTAAKKKM
jgi:mono/diheme cytochrome c family protein